MNGRRLSPADFAVEVLATAGYIGRFPWGPGTAASAAVCAAVYFVPSPRWIEAACAVSALAGIAIAGRARNVLRSKDPKDFVLDEVAGMALALAFVPLTPLSIALAFIFFRFFDIVKPLGVRSLDAVKHPAGIVLDDLLAGFYANLLVRLALHFLPHAV